MVFDNWTENIKKSYMLGLEEHVLSKHKEFNEYINQLVKNGADKYVKVGNYTVNVLTGVEIRN